MKEILAKKKRYVKFPQADQQPVPNHKSLEVTRVYPMMLEKLPGLIDFFPHYDEEYLPQKDFFWTVFKTAYP